MLTSNSIAQTHIKLQIGHWIRTLSGLSGTVIYNFKTKRTFVFSTILWDCVIQYLPDYQESLFTRLCFAFPSASQERINWFLDTLIKVGVLVLETDFTIEDKLEDKYPFADEISCFPKFASIEVSTRCNFRCLHCYLGVARNNPIDMPRSIIDKLSFDLKNLGVENLQVTGGEPLLRSDSIDIIESLSSFFLVDLTTNGICINDTIVDRLKCVNAIQISVYGFSEKSFASFIGSGGIGLKHLLDNILMVKSKGINLSLAYIVTNNNQYEITDFVSFCIENEIEYKLGFSMPIGACCDNISLLAMNLERKREIIRTYRGNLINEPTLKKYCCNPNKISVMADGRVLSCSMLREREEYVFGNVYDEPIANIWGRGVRKFAQATALDQYSPCSNCELRYVCGGICPALDRDKIIGSSIESCRVYNEKDLLIFKALKTN